MKITLFSTTKLITMVVDGKEIPARIWQGRTASGVKCHAYITRIAVAEGEDASEFNAEMQICEMPSTEIQEIPLRLIL